MPLSYECRQKYIKQNSPKFTVSLLKHENLPGPNQYDTPPIISGKGYNHIKRAPAYTFGHRYKNLEVPSTNPNTKLYNTACTAKGIPRIPLGVISQLTKPSSKQVTPGPGAYDLDLKPVFKFLPSYSIQPRAKPYKESNDVWSPGPNMYYPPIPGKRLPAYSFGFKRNLCNKDTDFPGPNTYEVNLKPVLKKTPKYSMGRFAVKKPPEQEPVQNYCQRKFFVNKKRAPSFSFGIKHTEHLGYFLPFQK